MRKLIVTALLLPFLGTTIRDPSVRSDLEPAPAGFPLHPERVEPIGVPPSVLLLPLDADAENFRMAPPDEGVAFDIDGDGVAEQVAWPESGARVAFLALDRDGDGRITSGRELIGRAMDPAARSGIAALLRLFERTESTRAGSIHAGHALYEQLLLWVDGNRDGRSDRDELTKARDRFTAIGLGYHNGDWADAHGNRIRWVGWMQARTAGPEQPEAILPADAWPRHRRFFEVQPRIQPAPPAADPTPTGAQRSR